MTDFDSPSKYDVTQTDSYIHAKKAVGSVLESIDQLRAQGTRMHKVVIKLDSYSENCIKAHGNSFFGCYEGVKNFMGYRLDVGDFDKPFEVCVDE